MHSSQIFGDSLLYGARLSGWVLWLGRGGVGGGVGGGWEDRDVGTKQHMVCETLITTGKPCWKVAVYMQGCNGDQCGALRLHSGLLSRQIRPGACV